MTVNGGGRKALNVRGRALRRASVSASGEHFEAGSSESLTDSSADAAGGARHQNPAPAFLPNFSLEWWSRGGSNP